METHDFVMEYFNKEIKMDNKDRKVDFTLCFALLLIAISVGLMWFVIF